MKPSVLPVPSARDASRVNDTELIIKRLNEFGLSEKDAQLYVHLLKYGPKRAVDLARSLKTYREDVNRSCARLIDIGMIVKGLEDLARYVPVELDEALESALRAPQNELRRLERTKQELIKDASWIT